MLHLKKIITAFCLFLSVAGIAQGQAHKVVVDKILAVVGDRIILQSNIKEELSDMERRGDPASAESSCIILENLLLSKIMAMQAEKDSLPVSDEDVEAELDVRVREWIMRFGSVQAVEEIAGKTIYQLKDDSRPQIKEQKLTAAMQRKIVENVRITPFEVKAYFDKVPTDSLPFLESEVEVGQINIYPKASKDVEEYIYNEMMNYRKQIEAGTVQFAEMAKRYSEDPGSKERGGSYEINRNDKNSWDAVFLSTAFRLKAGELSQPVKSNKFGYFLIKMEDRRGDDAKVRMILRIPPVTETELAEARQKLDSVRKDILANKISFKDAAYKYSEDENVKNYGPFVLNNDGSTYITLDRLDREMVATVGSLKVGDVSSPVNFTNEQGKKGVRLLYLKSKTEPHRLNLTDDYSKIADNALAQKKHQEIDKWLTQKIPNYYILVDKAAVKECPRLTRYHVTTESGF